MRMRTIASIILGIIVAANFASGQSLAEVARKEKGVYAEICGRMLTEK